MDIQLPNDVNLEVEILSMIMNSENCLNIAMDKLEGIDFYSSKNLKLFEAIKILWQQDLEVTPATLYSVLKDDINSVGGLSGITDILGSFTPAQGINGRIKLLRTLRQRRELLKISDTIIEAQKLSKSNEELVNIIQNTLDNVVKVEGDTGSISEAIDITLSSIEERYNNGGKIPGISTGLIDLDKKINGLKKSELTIIAGRPGSGKTTLANNIFWNIASKDNRVLLFNLEMGKEQILNKIFANIGNIKANAIECGNLNENEWTRLSNAANMFGKINSKCKIYDNIFGLNSIISECKLQNKKLNGLDLIIIDYLQLVDPQKRCGSKEEEIAHVSRTLKLLTQRLNCPIIALSQLSRAPEQRADHRPILSDLRGSGSVEQDANNVMFTYRDEYYNSETEEKNIMEIIIGKQRSGTVGTVKVVWLGDYQKIVDIDLVRK